MAIQKALEERLERLRHQPKGQSILSQLEESRLISAATVLETGIVLEARLGDASGREFDLFLIRVKVQIVPVDADLVEFARSAWRTFGKGRHPAGLNYGDCFSYALAKFTGEPLLAKGTDFSQADIAVVP